MYDDRGSSMAMNMAKFEQNTETTGVRVEMKGRLCKVGRLI